MTAPTNVVVDEKSLAKLNEGFDRKGHKLYAYDSADLYFANEVLAKSFVSPMTSFGRCEMCRVSYITFEDFPDNIFEFPDEELERGYE